MRRHAPFSFVAMVAAVACSRPAPARFADAPPVLEVDDARSIPVPERRLETPVNAAHALGERVFVEGLDPRRPRRAGDVNALDEVPRSSWFTELAGGPLAGITYVGSGPPEAPMRVIPRHPESGRNGLVVVDARGIRYELGRDPADRPRIRTTAAVVATRLVRALGYRAPETFIFDLREADLLIEALDGDIPPRAAVRAFLDDGGAPTPQRVFRASATRWPPGVDLGPTLPEGIRDDDSNDRIAHQDRRTLRALRVVRAWLGFRGFGGTLRDVYVGAPDKGHVEHFLVGFEGALGAHSGRGALAEPGGPDASRDPTEGREPQKALLTLGLGDPPRPVDPRFPSLGALDFAITDEDYDSDIAFAPTYRIRADDAYWVAKRIARVPDEGIVAAVGASAIGRASAERLIAILVARRDAVVERAFSDVTPCEPLRLENGSLVLRDLGYSASLPATFSIDLLDGDGNEIQPTQSISSSTAVFSIPIPSAPYLVFRIRAARGTWRAPRALEVHLRRRAGRDLVLVGVRH